MILKLNYLSINMQMEALRGLARANVQETIVGGDTKRVIRKVAPALEIVTSVSQQEAVLNETSCY